METIECCILNSKLLNFNNLQLVMAGDFTNSFKAFEKLKSPNFFRGDRDDLSLFDLFEILDVFDGTLDMIEQSIIGDVKGAYKKVKSVVKWLFVNIYNEFYDYGYDQFENAVYDHEWSTYG